ncbi:MFS general substrate transporter [Rhizopogon salebrosus TDB-379]|nr:MFS general substrate transporter [Rhizopogon salebrosus TDB-379]
MSSRPFHGVVYQSLPSEDSDVAFESSLDGDTILRTGGIPDRQLVEKSLLRKLDLRMSIFVLIYVLNFIDRSNAAAARLHGFEDDLHLEGQQFNTILSVFYIGYTLMQIPSNMFLDKIWRPSLYLPTSMVIWGLTTIIMGTTKGFIGAICTRFFLGFVEAAFFPGTLLLMSKWYKRRELGQRISVLGCGIMISNAFGSLFASAILDNMDGAMGRAAWRWLFYIEGFTTVFVAICAIFVLPDFPASVTSSGWLTTEEQALAILRMEEDAGGGNEEEIEDAKSGKSGLQQALSDWKVWWLALALTSLKAFLSFSDFFPTISATLGYTWTQSLLLCVPPWLFATCSALFMSRHSDQAGERFGHIATSLLVGISGFLVATTTMNTAVRYLSMFLMAQSFAGFMIFFAWISNSTSHPPSKQAVALAFISAFSTLGNIAGSYAWQKSWGPSYRISCAICTGTGALCIIMLWVFRQHLKRLNQENKANVEAGRSNSFTYLL